MNIIKSAWNFVRNTSGQTFYYRAGQGNATWDDLSDKIKVSYSNPILLPAIQLIADYFANAEFTDGGKDNTPLIKLLNKPNIYQTRDDFLKQYIWYKYSCGFNYILPTATGSDLNNISRVKFMENLKPDLIKFDDKFKTGIVQTQGEANKVMNQPFKYDQQGQNFDIQMKQVLTFYDLANGLEKNMFTAPSRIDSLKMPLTNIHKAFSAKNIVIDSNGKDMVTNKSVGNIAKVPMKTGEKADIEKKMSVDYGLGVGKKRTIITNSALEWQSLHIKLKELGLDESVIADAMIIIATLGVPPELFSLSGSSSTFENQSKAVIHFVQSKIQRELNDFTNTINIRYGTDLQASMVHLPMFKDLEKTKALSLKSVTAGMKLMVDALIFTPAEAKAEYYEWKEKM